MGPCLLGSRKCWDGEGRMLKAPYPTAQEQFKAGYCLRMERATVVALLLLILCFQLVPRYEARRRPLPLVPPAMEVQEVPVTRQHGAVAPPQRPAVPVPVDDPELPADETIELTELSFAPSLSGAGDPLGEAPGLVTPPRPVAEVFPEYPKSAREKGIQGVVKLSLLVAADGTVAEAIVISNTTGSEACAQAALKAARATRFIPGRRRGVPVPTWTIREYGFYF